MVAWDQFAHDAHQSFLTDNAPLRQSTLLIRGHWLKIRNISLYTACLIAVLSTVGMRHLERSRRNPSRMETRNNPFGSIVNSSVNPALRFCKSLVDAVKQTSSLPRRCLPTGTSGLPAPCSQENLHSWVELPGLEVKSGFGRNLLALRLHCTEKILHETSHTVIF